MTPLFLVNSCMAPPTQCQQILQRVVAQLLRCRNSSPINVVDVEIFCCAAPLTSEIVALQSRLPIAPKVVIVLSSSDVLVSLRAICKSLQTFFSAPLLDAGFAMFLRPRAVDEVGAAFRALKRGPHRYSAFFLPQLAQVKRIPLLLVDRAAGFTALLSRASGLVKHFADQALALLKPIASLTMSGQRAWLAPLKIRRCFSDCDATVWAKELSVFACVHNLNQELSVL